MLVPTLRPSLEAAPARRALNLALALMLPLALLALALHLPATHNPAPIAAPQVPPLYRSIADLPQPLQFAISRDLGRDDPAYHLTANAARIHAANPAQKFAATVDDEGLHLTAGDQTWALRLAAWGSGDRLGTLPAAQPQRTHDNRLTIDYGAIMAWYVNGPLGLQQGWTIAEPPPGAANGPLTLALDQGGSLSGTVASDQHSLLLRDPAGIVRLRYAGLLAYDADGRELPAWLEADGTRLRISVDATRAAYPLTIDPWVQTAKLTTTDTPDGDLWGLKVAVNGDGSTIVLGAPYQNQVRGIGYVYSRLGKRWTDTLQTAKLTASDGAAWHYLGGEVAVSGDGSTIVLSGYDGGYVYVRPPNGWADTTQAAKLKGNDSPVGSSIAIDNDGGTIVLGMATKGAGVGYVFLRPPSGWVNATQIAKLFAFDGIAGDFLSSAAAISADGRTIVLGAKLQANGGKWRGAGYVYVRPENSWSDMTQNAKLTASDSSDNDLLGSAVSISGDGSTVVLGAPRWTNGAGYVYVRSENAWANMTQTAKLTSSDSAMGDSLGVVAAISADGTTILLSAPNNDAGGFDRGAGYLFVRPTAGWVDMTQSLKLTASVPVNGDHIGHTGAMSADGNTVVLAALTPNALVTPNPAAQVFEQLWKIDSGIPAKGQVDHTYSFTFTTNITSPLTWSVSSGSLPPGLTLNAATGVLSGTPTLAGSYTFTIQADDGTDAANQIVTVVIHQAPAITNDQPPAALVGETYTFTFTASGADGDLEPGRRHPAARPGT